MKLLIAALLLIGCLVLYTLNSMGGYQYYYGGSTVTVSEDVSEPVWSYGESRMSTTAPTWSYGESYVLDK